jgi:hypothetical protein
VSLNWPHHAVTAMPPALATPPPHAPIKEERRTFARFVEPFVLDRRG